MGHGGQAAVFGKRREPHTVIIARGDEIRHFTVRPWMAAVLGSAVAAASIGYVLATSYLVFRDDLISASVSRQARMQQDYEDRISALRAQVDRITSRQLLDQKIVENKVSQLIERQGRLRELNDRLSSGAPPGGGPLPDAAPAPSGRPDLRASWEPVPARAALLGTEALSFLRSETAPTRSAADRADLMFVALNESLRGVESDQLARIEALTDETYRTNGDIGEALRSAGLDLDAKDGDGAVGGPFVPAGSAMPFDAKLRELDAALDRLDGLKTEVRRLPLANPAPDRPVSSTFGVRKDPLLGTPAMHAGIDFRAPAGMAAAATAPGTVVKAGWNGGYGRMVEIDHGNGFSTRYAHLSGIDVAEGDRVEAGQTIGEVGSTGRSTGPHLHYEVRDNGTAVDPLRFLKAGKKIGRLM